MDDMTLFEQRFEERLRAFARAGVPSIDSVAVARTVAVGHPRSAAARPAVRRLGNEVPTGRPAVIGPWRTRSTAKNALGAAAAIALLVSGTALFLSRPSQPAVTSQSPTAGPPSAAPTATPSATPTPLLWTQASLKEDWPVPVRAEPAGGASVQPFPVDNLVGADGHRLSRYIDPSGDTGSAVHPWVDIQEVGGPTGFDLASNQPPLVDPTEQWIAYGVVFDEDRDGVPDWRYGIDNMPINATDRRPHRAWRTDLHTGRTDSKAGPPYGFVDEPCEGSVPPCGFGFDTWYPPEWTYGSDVHFSFGGGDATGGRTGPRPKQLDMLFYVWASVIQDGRGVATDYAPDVGWLDQAESSPDPTPQIESSPGPTPQVENDPDVPGGRLWTAPVVNKSPRLATLFVAEDNGDGGMGRLVGTATPNVVPAGATVKVTFALPPVDLEGWAIFVKTGPSTGGGLGWSDVPTAGEFRITANGNVGWLSP
jgi:hypothetical protein